MSCAPPKNLHMSWCGLRYGMSKISLYKMFCRHVKTAHKLYRWVFLHTVKRRLIYIPETLVIAAPHTDILESKTSMLHFCDNNNLYGLFQISGDGWPHTQLHTHACCICFLMRHHLTLIHGDPVDLQVIMLVPLRVKRISHSICRVALSWAIHHHFGKRIWQPCEGRQRQVKKLCLAKCTNLIRSPIPLSWKKYVTVWHTQPPFALFLWHCRNKCISGFV